MAVGNSASGVETDGTGHKDLNDIIKVRFVVAANPPIGEKVVFDDQSSVSSIMGINKVRATVGSGDGSTGWVKIKEITPTVPTKEVQVQLSKVTDVKFIADGQGSAVLMTNGVVLGVVHDPTALAKVKSQFSH
jgi:hypothetical protein